MAAPPPLERQRRQTLGVAVLLGLAALVLLAHGWRSSQRRDAGLERGWQTLAALPSARPQERHGLILKAQGQFSRAVALVSLEPLAMVGVAVTDGLAERWGQPLPLPPSATQCSDEEAAAWLRGALERGKPAQALEWAEDPAIRRRGSLQALLRFAEGWLRAAEGQKQLRARPL